MKISDSRFQNLVLRLLWRLIILGLHGHLLTGTEIKLNEDVQRAIVETEKE